MTGVRLTGPGADKGIDVTANSGIAQVKYQATPVSAPAVQGALGAGLGHQKVLFFALSGFTQQALVFAQRAGMALFSYDIYGAVTPRNAEAQSLLTIDAVEPDAGRWSRAEQLQKHARDLELRAEQERQEAREAIERSRRQLATVVEMLERQTDAEVDDEALSFILAEYSTFLRPSDGLLVGGPIDAAGICEALVAARAIRPVTPERCNQDLPGPAWSVEQAAREFLDLYDELGDMNRLRTLRLPQWVETLDGWHRQEARISLLVRALVSVPAGPHSQAEVQDVILFGLAAQEGHGIADRWQTGLSLGDDLEALEATITSDPLGRGREWSRRVLEHHRLGESLTLEDDVDEEILTAEAAGVIWDPTRYFFGSRREDVMALRNRLGSD